MISPILFHSTKQNQQLNFSIFNDQTVPSSPAIKRKKNNSPLAVNVPQAKGAILDAKKFGYGKLGTYGANSCCIVAAYCAGTNRIFMAHIDSQKYVMDCCAKINYWLRDDKSQQVDVHLLSGSGEWDNLRTRVLEIPNANIVQCELNNSFESLKQLILDTNGVYTSNFDINEVSTLSDLEQSANNLYALSMAYDNRQECLMLKLKYDEKNRTENKRPPGCTLDNVNLSNTNEESANQILNTESILSVDSCKNIGSLLNLYKQKTSMPTSELRDNTLIDPKNNPFQIIKSPRFCHKF